MECLKINIYVGERLDNNLRAIAIVCFCISMFALVTTMLNIYHGYFFMALSTGIIYILSSAGAIGSSGFKSRHVGTISLNVALIAIFSLYIIYGSNQGFASLWTLLLPSTIMYLVDVRIGLYVSIYFEILYCVCYYSSWRSHYVGIYSDIYLARFPILFACAIALGFAQMVQYHINCVHQMELEKELKVKLREEQYRLLGTELKLEKVARNKNITGLDVEPEMLKINREAGLKECLDDEEFYKDLLTTFYEQGTDNVLRLVMTAQEGDYDGYRILVHALKNTAHAIGAERFSELSKVHEYAVRDKDYKYVDEHFEIYVATYSRLLTKAREMV